MSEPNPIDVHVGSRVRIRRTLLGLTQGQIGEALGLTFQQIQKYERGANRIGSSRLFKLSNLLDVPVTYFFDDMPDQLERHARSRSDETAEMFDQNLISSKETLDLVRNYYKIRNPNLRKRIFELIKGIAQARK